MGSGRKKPAPLQLTSGLQHYQNSQLRRSLIAKVEMNDWSAALSVKKMFC